MATFGGDISTASEQLALLRLFVSPNNTQLDQRLPALLEALRALDGDQSFNDSNESVFAYRAAAERISAQGFSAVIFGHTHLAKSVDLGGGRRYLNSGTWADLIRVPRSIIDRANAHALEELRDLASALRDDRFSSWQVFRPTYVHLVFSVDDDQETLVHATLEEAAN